MKKKKALIIMTLIALIILVVILAVLNYNSKESIAKRQIYVINNLEQEYSDYILPLNKDEFMSKYEGELSNETIYVLMYRFAKDILPEFKHKHITDAENYFNKNKEYINIVLGIKKMEEFKKLIDRINDLSTDDLNFTKYKIEEKSVRRYGTHTDAKLIITYNEDENIVIDISVSKKQKDDITSVSFK